MSRRRFVVAYDIREPKRLRRVHEVVKGYGYPMQYSVFICDLSDREKIGLKGDLRDVMDQSVDSVAFIDLGEPGTRGVDSFEFMGTRQVLPPAGGAMIV